MHWDLVWRWPGAQAAVADLWREAKPARIFDSPGYVLSPEWELLFLATHLSRHRWQGLKWLIDIHEFCTTAPLDWDKLNAKASWVGWGEMLALTLGASHALLDTPIPPGAPFRPPPRWLMLFPADPAPASILKGALLPLRSLARGWRKVQYLAALLFIPTLTERRTLSLPRWLGFLHYPLRPARLIMKWGGELIRMRSLD